MQYTHGSRSETHHGGQTHLPLKVNTPGVIPPIFASSLLMFPAQLANLMCSRWMQSSRASNAATGSSTRSSRPHRLLRFFYTAVTFQPVDVADNLKKSGGFIPGIRPGKQTAEYIDRVLTRITFAGALYLSASASCRR